MSKKNLLNRDTKLGPKTIYATYTVNPLGTTTNKIGSSKLIKKVTMTTVSTTVQTTTDGSNTTTTEYVTTPMTTLTKSTTTTKAPDPTIPNTISGKSLSKYGSLTASSEHVVFPLSMIFDEDIKTYWRSATTVWDHSRSFKTRS